MRPADEYVYVFHHIPKCGGASITTAMRQWFRLRLDYRPPWAAGQRLDRFRNRPLRLDRINPGTVISSHFEVEGCFLHQRYPEVLTDPRFRLITFVREPLELRLSLLRYELDHRLPGSEGLLEERLLGRRNWLAERFPLTADDMESVLDRYHFIGRMDDLQGSWDALSAWLGKPKILLRHLNRSTSRAFPLSDELTARFRTTHALDEVVYRRCTERAGVQGGVTRT